MESKSKSRNQSSKVARGVLWSVLVLVIVSILGANIWSAMQQKSERSAQEVSELAHLATHNQLPEFSLLTQGNMPLSLSDLRGKIWVADFIFTNCLTICPVMTDKMATLQREFAENDDICFVSFSVDPMRDTPEVLSRYAARYHADGDRWSFLTGEKKAIYQLAHDGFSLATGHQGSEILHSTRFALVDRQGQVRGYYDSRSKAALQQLRRDIKTLIAMQ